MLSPFRGNPHARDSPESWRQQVTAEDGLLLAIGLDTRGCVIVWRLATAESVVNCNSQLANRFRRVSQQSHASVYLHSTAFFGLSVPYRFRPFEFSFPFPSNRHLRGTRSFPECAPPTSSASLPGPTTVVRPGCNPLETSTDVEGGLDDAGYCVHDRHVNTEERNAFALNSAASVSVRRARLYCP